MVPEYKELEREANDLTRSIDTQNADNVLDGDLVRQCAASSNRKSRQA